MVHLINKIILKLFGLTILLTVISCNNQSPQINQKIKTTEIVYHPTIKCFDTLLFRKSYQFMTKRELLLQEKQGPQYIDFDTTAMYRLLEKKNIVKDGCLKIKRFKSRIAFLYNANKTDSIKVILPNIPDDGVIMPADYLLQFKKANQIDSIRFPGISYGIEYLTADLIPGGFEELLVYRTYYIMNGDNYELYIFQADQ